MKRKIIICSIILFAIGIFSITISFNDFFFTTKYYNTPLAAYNAESFYHTDYGDTVAEKELAIVALDEETCLFIGAMNNNCFVVCEMYKKNNRYASKGLVIIFDIREATFSQGVYTTAVSNGSKQWKIISEEETIDPDIEIVQIKAFTHINGKIFHLLVYAD